MCTQGWEFSLKDGIGHFVVWKNRPRSESPPTVFVHSVLILRHKWYAECSNVFPEPTTFALSIRTQAQPGRTVRTERLIFACIQSIWNDHKRFTVNASRGGFSSVFLVDFHPWVQNQSVLRLIYYHFLHY